MSPRAICQRWPVTAFCVFAYALSWSYWFTLIGLGYHVEPGSRVTHLPGLAGPWLAALMVTAIGEGWSGVRALLYRCVSLPRPRLQSIALALSPLVLGTAVIAILSLAGHLAPHPADFKTYPGALEEWSFPLVVIAALLLNGLGEEAGWRGFALAGYAQRQKPLQAALCVAAIWMLWHAPLFVLNASMAALLGPALLGWALGLAAGSVVLAWLYLKTDSILVPALWHTGFNFMVATVPGRGLVAAILSTVVMVLALVIARRWLD